MAKLEELQTVKTSGYITIPFSVSWSRDNFLSYVTDKGVNVIELMLSGVSDSSRIKTRHWFIKPRLSVPTHDCLINVAKLGEKLSPDELLKLVLDRTMSPKASLGGISPNIVAASWSPLCASISDTCLLACLTDLGSLDIYSYGEQSWNHLISISDHWSSHCKVKWTSTAISDLSPLGILSELKERSYCVKINSYSWGYCDRDILILLIGNLLGEVAMWRLDCVKQTINVTCLLIYKTDLDSVGSLHCLPLDQQNSMVMVGCASGKVQCLMISIPELPVESGASCVRAKSMVWSDMDQIPVPVSGSIGVVFPEGVIYVVPKLGHLLIFWLDSDANLINFTTFSSDDIYITGIEWLYDDEFLICTCNGDILTLQVITHLLSNTVDVVVNRGEFLSKNNSSSYYGLAASNNSCIFAISYCICTAHDPSVIKEPTSLGLFTMSSHYVKHKSILSKDVLSYHSLWDHMELMRIDPKTTKNLVLSISQESDDVFESMNINKLKTTYWLIKISLQALLNEDIKLVEHLNALLKEIKQAIISFYLFTRVNYLTSKDRNELTREQLESLSLAQTWFKLYCSNGRFKSYMKKSEMILASSLRTFELDENEECPLCFDKCDMIDVNLMMICKHGHTLSRCPISLLPVVGPPYYVCIYCGETSSAREIEDSKVCIMCDGPLRRDYHLIRNGYDLSLR